MDRNARADIGRCGTRSGYRSDRRTSSPLPYWRIHRLIGYSVAVSWRVSTPKQRIELSAEPGFQHLDLDVGHAKGAVDLELNRPAGLLVWTSSPTCRGSSRYRFRLNGHSPTRGHVYARWIAERGERPLVRLVALWAAASPDPPIAGCNVGRPVSPPEWLVR